jgi:hypothetical protein
MEEVDGNEWMMLRSFFPFVIVQVQDCRDIWAAIKIVFLFHFVVCVWVIF